MRKIIKHVFGDSFPSRPDRGPHIELQQPLHPCSRIDTHLFNNSILILHSPSSWLIDKISLNNINITAGYDVKPKSILVLIVLKKNNNLHISFLAIEKLPI